MEEKSFKWLLEHLVQTGRSFPILNSYLCSGEFVRTCYTSDFLPCSMRVQHLLAHLLEEVCPLFTTSSPKQPICIAYLREGLQILTLNSILTLPKSRIHSMKFQSIHTVPRDQPCQTLVRVRASNKSHTILCSYTNLVAFGGFVSRKLVTDRAREIAVALRELLARDSLGLLKTAVFDLLIDTQGNAYLVRVFELLVYTGYGLILPDTEAPKNTSGTQTNSNFLEIITKTFKRRIKGIQRMNSLRDIVVEVEKSRPPKKTFPPMKVAAATVRGFHKAKVLLRQFECTDKAKVFEHDATLRKLRSVSRGKASTAPGPKISRSAVKDS